MIRVIDTETCVMTSVTVRGFETCVATCFKTGIATQGFEAGVASHRFETDVPDKCLMADVTAQYILTADAALAVTSLYDE